MNLIPQWSRINPTPFLLLVPTIGIFLSPTWVVVAAVGDVYTATSTCLHLYARATGTRGIIWGMQFPGTSEERDLKGLLFWEFKCFYQGIPPMRKKNKQNAWEINTAFGKCGQEHLAVSVSLHENQRAELRRFLNKTHLFYLRLK